MITNAASVNMRRKLMPELRTDFGPNKAVSVLLQSEGSE
jgi:hypothetical protein